MKVLLVEDELPLREVLQEFLQDAGYTVRTAGTADEVQREASAAGVAFDVILTDVALPGGSGVELVRALRRRWPGLRVVYMSGSLDDQIGSAEMGKAGTYFLPKPFTRASLLEMMKQALASAVPS